MLKKVFIAILTLISVQTFAQNVDEILAQYEETNGGREKFASTTTLQFTSTIKMNMMGMSVDLPIYTYIETGKLFRKEVSGMMGMKGSYTLVTDSAGFTFTPSVPAFGDFPGMEGGIKKMDEETFKSMRQKMNAMSDFDALIDCKSKGCTVELLGKEKIDTNECYKLKLTNKAGGTSLYFIDPKTYLTKQIEVAGKQIMDMIGVSGGPMKDMMGGRIDKQKMKIQYLEYATIDGIKFPIKQKLQFGANDIEIENSDIQLNTIIDKKWYSN